MRNNPTLIFPCPAFDCERCYGLKMSLEQPLIELESRFWTTCTFQRGSGGGCTSQVIDCHHTLTSRGSTKAAEGFVKCSRATYQVVIHPDPFTANTEVCVIELEYADLPAHDEYTLSSEDGPVATMTYEEADSGEPIEIFVSDLDE